VIYNGVDLDELDALRWDLPGERAKLGLSPEDCIIGCVANFNAVKGHLTLVDAFARLLTQRPEAPLKLLLAGDGPMRSAIEARVAGHGIGSSVILMGRSQAVSREFQLSDVVVLPSETEGFSNSIIQAMAYRKPVVACRVGGNPEAIEDGVTGLLVPPKDPETLAQALDRLVADEALRRRMGEAGRERVTREFTKQVMLRKTEAMIVRLAGH
jgi:glycosyltransferase involved in cell wall biosynthesis